MTLAAPQRQPTWSITVSAVAATVAGLALVLLGVLLGRSDVTVLGVPLVVGVLWDWARRPVDAASVSFGTLQQESRPGVVAHSLGVGAASGVSTVLLRVTAPGHRPVLAFVGCERPHALRLSIRTVRTGQRDLFAVTYLQSGRGQVVKSEPVSAGVVTVTVLPGVRRLGQLPLPVRLQGLTGPHGSLRVGDGGDLRDINEFLPGDRLRRIDWRVTARRSATAGADPLTLSRLYVRRTFATADATVMLVLDSRDDVGPDVTTWGDAASVRQDEATSLDIAREAAASLARQYLHAGDRVGLEDLGRLRRPVPPAGGRQQLQRLVQRLALAQPEGEPTRRERAPRLPSGALIIVFSTFLDDDAARLAQGWRSSGHRVLAVDVLPRMARTPLPARVDTAYRIVSMERADRLLSLSRSGVEVVRWEDAAGSDHHTRTTSSTPATRADSTASTPVEVSLSALARQRRPRR